MPEILVIADTSCLIVLSKINELNLLKELYSVIYITPEIASEFGEPLPNWIIINEVQNKNYQKILNLILDKGEASAIALALECENVLLIIDDLKGRKEAEKLGLKLTGTLGILVKAKQKEILPNIKSRIEALKAIEFRISGNLEIEILKVCNET